MVLFVPIVISSTRTACYCCQNARAKAEHKKLTKNFSLQRCFTLNHNIGVLSSPYTLSYPTSTSLIDVYLCMWYKPRIYTLDHTTCLLCRPPLPLLISEAVKIVKTFLVGVDWEVAMYDLATNLKCLPPAEMHVHIFSQTLVWQRPWNSIFSYFYAFFDVLLLIQNNFKGCL